MSLPEQQLPVLFVLDEFATMGKFDLIVKAMARMRGLGCPFILCVQNLSQLKNLYGEAGETEIRGNAGVLSYFGGTNDTYTAKVISELSGVGSVVVPGSSINEQGSSVNYTVASRPIYMPDEVMRLPLPEQLIKISGRQVMRERLFLPSLEELPQYLAFQSELTRSGDLCRAVQSALSYQHQSECPREERVGKGRFASWLKRFGIF